ncbi:MAG TPA: CopG family transcriptional regulator [Actinomycetes bacterium]|nr:CopG family transcriptional regulator [Actinomycetes bacterium]
MQKTTVYLPEALTRRLAQAAPRRGQPEAALIRAAIERLLDDEARPRPTLPLFRSGDPTLAERVDEALAGFGE